MAIAAPPTGDPRTVVTWPLAREADGWWVVARQFAPVVSPARS